MKETTIENILFIIMMIPLCLAISNRMVDIGSEPEPQLIEENIGFKAAFKEARGLTGPWGIFTWDGQEYNTLYKEEE